MELKKKLIKPISRSWTCNDDDLRHLIKLILYYWSYNIDLMILLLRKGNNLCYPYPSSLPGGKLSVKQRDKIENSWLIPVSCTFCCQWNCRLRELGGGGGGRGWKLSESTQAIKKVILKALTWDPTLWFDRACKYFSFTT